MADEARTVLIHLNVTVPAEDSRTVDQIQGAIEAALEVGSDHESLHGLHVEIAHAEEIG